MLQIFRPLLIVFVIAIVASQLLSLHPINAQTVDTSQTRPAALPSSAQWVRSLSNEKVNVYRDARTLWLVLGDQSLEEHRATLPRLCAPIRSIQWKNASEPDIQFVPEIDHWVFSWKEFPSPDALIEVVLDSDPVLPDDCPPAESAGDGSVMLFAYQASTFGEKLRFEPQWYKNTVGYWAVPSDYATWKLKIDSAGEYSVAVLQGCGKGQGGSDALVTLQRGDEIAAELPFQTVDTGHFQRFRWNDLGNIKLVEPGMYQLRIDAKRIAKVALFDVRMIHLVKQAE